MNTAEAAIVALAETLDFPISISAQHLTCDRAIHVAAEQPFWLASTYKVPMAITALQQVERGALSLDQQVPILHHDYISPGIVSEWLDAPGTQLPLLTLLTLMLTHSDNTATDVVYRVIGGAAPVKASLADIGITGLSVDRNTATLITDYFDSPAMRQRLEQGENARDAWANTLADEQDKAAWDALLEQRRTDSAYQAAQMTDPRDKGCTAAMTRLLVAVARGEVLNPHHTQMLRTIMQRCVTGDQRIRAGVPNGVVVADKTGSLFPVAGAINDVGWLELPNGESVALSVFTGIDGEDITAQERAIAQVAGIVCDYFIEAD